jgi:hypothetical protein
MEPSEKDIMMVINQTDYTREEVIEKLRLSKPIDVIKTYMGIKPKKDTHIKAEHMHQEIFKNIRNFLDSNTKQLD